MSLAIAVFLYGLMTEVESGPQSTSPTVSDHQEERLTRPAFVKAGMHPALTSDANDAHPAFTTDAKNADIPDIGAAFDLANRFEDNEPSIGNERRMSTVLDEVFREEVTKGPRYKLECRGDICKFWSLTNDRNLWYNDLHRSRFMWRSLLTSNDPTVGTLVYVELLTREREETGRVRVGIWDELMQSSNVALCLRKNPTHGTVTFHVSFDGKRLVLGETGGSLANAPGGQCLRVVVEEVINTTSVALHDLRQ